MINPLQRIIIPSDIHNLAQFDIIKKAYNEGNAAQIYNLFSEETQKATMLEIFSQQIQDIRNRQGNISYWSYSTINPQKPSVLLGFEKHLGTGTLFWTYNQKSQINSFSMNDHTQPSMIQWIKQYTNKFSFTSIADDNIIANYFGSREQSLMSVFKINIAIEYCKQLNEGRINGEDWIKLDEIFHIQVFCNFGIKKARFKMIHYNSKRLQQV